jgi:hypothetical protein
VCYPNLTASKLVAISIFMNFLFDLFAFSLQIFFSLQINKSLLVLLLNKWKLSYFICYRYLNLNIGVAGPELRGYSFNALEIFGVKMGEFSVIVWKFSEERSTAF